MRRTLTLNNRTVSTNRDILNLLEVKKGKVYKNIIIEKFKFASNAASKAFFHAINKYHPQLERLSVTKCVNLDGEPVGNFVNPFHQRQLTSLKELRLLDMIVDKNFSAMLVRGLQLNHTIRRIALANLGIHSGDMARIMFDLNKRVIVDLYRWLLGPVQNYIFANALKKESKKTRHVTVVYNDHLRQKLSDIKQFCAALEKCSVAPDSTIIVCTRTICSKSVQEMNYWKSLENCKLGCALGNYSFDSLM